MANSPFDTLDRVSQRTTSAVVARAGTKSLALREFLARALVDPSHPGSFMREPQIEAVHGYVAAVEKLDDLAGNLLQRELVNALDGGDQPETGDRDRYQFRRSWYPFRHQIEAWKELLAPEPRSVLVTSGTGSGKTECFLVPLLNSLVEQSLTSQSMVGVQAIMLYPLNALINSQRERLSDWTSPFKGKIKFALYNGATPETKPEINRQQCPEEVIDRTILRSAPPPILVTNITMLEYMLVRFEDSPILHRSKGKLRYIILDEAHSYVGSQAAELSLLLRRVLHAFGVEPQNVKFVATSATIGRHGDQQTKDGLRKFLSQVAGIAKSQVTVIEGERKIPELPKLAPTAILPTEDEIRSLDPEQLFDRLGSTKNFVSGFTKITREPMSFDEWNREIGVSDRALGRALLQAGSRAERNGERLLPIRIHAFHRSQSGAWACINPQCNGRKTRLSKILLGHSARFTSSDWNTARTARRPSSK